jgi:hypothetical protein
MGGSSWPHLQGLGSQATRSGDIIDRCAQLSCANRSPCCRSCGLSAPAWTAVSAASDTGASALHADVLLVICCCDDQPMASSVYNSFLCDSAVLCRMVHQIRGGSSATVVLLCEPVLSVVPASFLQQLVVFAESWATMRSAWCSLSWLRNTIHHFVASMAYARQSRLLRWVHINEVMRSMPQPKAPAAIIARCVQPLKCATQSSLPPGAAGARAPGVPLPAALLRAGSAAPARACRAAPLPAA